MTQPNLPVQRVLCQYIIAAPYTALVCNNSASGRPAFVMTYTAADAMPYTAPPYPSSHYRVLVRGNEPHYARHEEVRIPLPPDWSGGYTSIFDHQEDNS